MIQTMAARACDLVRIPVQQFVFCMTLHMLYAFSFLICKMDIMVVMRIK